MQPLQRAVWKFFKKFKIELPYGLAVVLLGIHPEETKTLCQRDICNPIVTVHPYTHTLEYYSAIKKEGNPAICHNMDGL